MKPEQVADLLERDPFVPIQVSLSDGDRFVIALPYRAQVTRDELIVGVSKDPFAPPEKRRLRFIPLERVQSMVDVTLSEPRRRPKK